MITEKAVDANDYLVRRLTDEDADGVVACVRGVYGDSYIIHTELYHPEEIIALNECGRLVSAVAVHVSGRVVGHYALERPDTAGRIAESGEAMVLREHQHHHLLERMRVILEAEAYRLELRGIFGRTVTNHVFSQRAVERFGERPCGISLGRTPKTFHNLERPLSQRMSIVLYFKYLRRPQTVAVHAPSRHREVCRRIYEEFNVSVDFREGAAATGPGHVDVEHHPELQRAIVRVCRVGADTAEMLSRLAKELSGRQVEVTYLDLPLADAGTPSLCEEAEQLGFFFAGIGPYFFTDGDALRMQRLAVDLDTSVLEIENAFARDLLHYIEEERQRVRG